MKIVKENIDFKRGIDPKKSLGVGMTAVKDYNYNPHNFQESFAERFNDLEFAKLSVWGYNYPGISSQWGNGDDKAHISFHVKISEEEGEFNLEYAKDKFESLYKKDMLKWIKEYTPFTVKRFTFNYFDNVDGGTWAHYDIPLKRETYNVS